MNASITVKTVANDDITSWLVLATLEGGRPDFTRRHLAFSASSESEALGIAGQLISMIPSRAGDLRPTSDAPRTDVSTIECDRAIRARNIVELRQHRNVSDSLE